MEAARYFAAILSISMSAICAYAAPQTVAIPNRTDMVFDDSRGLLYITTNDGNVLRYNPATNTLLAPWSVGVDLRAADITPNGAYLLAAEHSAGSTQGIIRRVDLDTGGVTNLFYPLAGEGAGATDIVTMNDGRAIFSADFAGSGFSPPLRVVDLSTFAISPFTINGQTQYVEQATELWRSRDRSTVFMNNTTSSSGAVHVFSTASENFLVNTGLGTDLNGVRAALTPNGSVLAWAGYNVDFAIEHSNDLSLIELLPDARGGVTYDPTGSLLYVASFLSNAIVMYRTSDYHEVGSFSAGINIDPFAFPGNGTTISGDGRWLFLSTYSALYVFSVTPVPEPDGIIVSLAGVAMLLSGRSKGRRHAHARN